LEEGPTFCEKGCPYTIVLLKKGPEGQRKKGKKGMFKENGVRGEKKRTIGHVGTKTAAASFLEEEKSCGKREGWHEKNENI